MDTRVSPLLTVYVCEDPVFPETASVEDDASVLSLLSSSVPVSVPAVVSAFYSVVSSVSASVSKVVGISLSSSLEI